MVTEGEVLLHGREPDGALLVRASDVFGCGPGVEVQVDVAAQSAPRDVGRAEEDLVGVGVAQKDAMRIRLVLPDGSVALAT